MTEAAAQGQPTVSPPSGERPEVEQLLKAWVATGARDDDAWAAAKPGPSLAAVSSRLSAAPSPFLAPHIDAIAIVRDVGVEGPLAFATHAANGAVAQGAALAAWLLASESLVAAFDPPLGAGNAARMVDALALRLAPSSPPVGWLSDGDRREEAARLALLWAGYLPAGETEQVARGLYEALDTVRRNKALAKVEQEELHRRAIAQKLSDAAAREAAARYSRE